MDSLYLWSFLRILISLVGAAVSDLRPIHLLEKNISAWPPVQPLSSWLERLLISPMFRWDANIYVNIAIHGLNTQNGTVSFHPLYPLFARPLMFLGLSSEISLLFISNIAGIGFLYYFYKLSRLDLNQEQSYTSVLLVLFSPLVFLLFIPYSEALFLLFSTISLLNCLKKNWLYAGIAGGLAALTRQQGIFLVFPLVWELWEESQGNIRILFSKWKSWTTIFIIPACYASLILYRGIALNDVSYDLTNPLNAIYTILLSPSHTQVVPHFRFLFPWQVIFIVAKKIIYNPDVDIWTNIVLGFLFLTMAILAWPRLRNSYRIFVTLNFIVALSYYTGEVHPYMGMPRHLWLAFPLYIGISPLIQKPWLRIVIVSLGTLLMSYLLILYVLEAWVP